MYNTYPNYSNYFQPGNGAVTGAAAPSTMPMPNQRPFMQQSALKGRPVSSLDEVRGTTIDFDGSIFYFPDVANKRIYTKQINVDGTSTTSVYELRNTPLEQESGNYVTREEFDATMVQLKQILEQITQAQQEAQQKPKSIVSQF